jgi:hypothetical protein
LTSPSRCFAGSGHPVWIRFTVGHGLLPTSGPRGCVRRGGDGPQRDDGGTGVMARLMNAPRRQCGASGCGLRRFAWLDHSSAGWQPEEGDGKRYGRFALRLERRITWWSLRDCLPKVEVNGWREDVFNILGNGTPVSMGKTNIHSLTKPRTNSPCGPMPYDLAVFSGFCHLIPCVTSLRAGMRAR